ncbi:hypothetical protein EOI86_13450 [Hwanghaeella grinnelliae]|uniref:HipA-like kinase domain-containing protein n=1 Tax=Hwanghaeella grinnelliae TaxID=2500179 RepID=A0A3S2Z8L3_9PROT|nr:HipA family kinase [Hwanghaeella grinnelliae]RVU36222.1 hypothetical protein EOI86_13450 [Hwanghaeella grinnelliae]
MAEIKLATVLFGATSFNIGNVSDTYRGQVLLEDSSVRQAIIKDLPLIELCNELLTHSLAKLLGLPVPDCYLGLVRDGALTVAKAPELQAGGHLVFVSVDVKVPNVTFQLKETSIDRQKALLLEISKWVGLGWLYAFDSWVANVDRHCGNLLFANPGEVWIIDHGFSFTGPRWKPGDLDPVQTFANRLSEWMTPMLTSGERETRRSEAASFEASLKGFRASGAMANSRVGELLPKDHLEALEAFLEKRVTRITSETSNALGIPELG